MGHSSPGRAPGLLASAQPNPNLPEIHFTCPSCQTVYQAPAAEAGKKAACRNCGQRLQVPRQSAKTVLGDVVQQGAFARDALPFTLSGSPIPLAPPDPQGARPPPVPGVQGGPFEGLDASRQEEALVIGPTGESKKHSGLGIASFLIALLVGGLDVIVVFITAVGLATTNRAPDTAVNLLGGLMALGCLNCGSVPLCIVGVGLAVVALIAHKGSNQLFSWIGLLGNGAIIACVIGLYVVGAVAGKLAENGGFQGAQPAPKTQKWKF